MGVISLLPGGWIVGGIYFLSDGIISSLTGHSIGYWMHEAAKMNSGLDWKLQISQNPF